MQVDSSNLLAPEFIGRVFDTFARAGGHVTDETEGTGLGMAIATKLVNLMGGTIECQSELGCGTMFTVVLPVRYANEDELFSATSLPTGSHAGHADTGASVPDIAGKRILLVEDNDINREIARHIILETGAEIVEANDGKKAVFEFSKNPEGYFDLIFMDIQLPVMNGYEATAAIHSMNRADAAAVLIYAMTANTFNEDVRQVKDAGMNGHVVEPYNPQKLHRVLSHALGA